MRKALLLCSLLLPALVQAGVPMMPDAQKRGQARMSVLFWDVYDATLYTKKGKNFSFQSPFALQLDYLMALTGEDIAQRSVEEIRKLGYSDEVKLAAWFTQMGELFPDVKEGASLTGLYRPNQPTVFYQGGTKLGQIRDPEFGRWFFGIWLDERTSNSRFRSQLLEQK